MQQAAEHVCAVKLGERIADDQIPSQRFGAGAQHGECLRVNIPIDKERFGFALAYSLRERHRFGFELAGTLRSVGFKHERWIDTPILQRTLGPPKP